MAAAPWDQVGDAVAEAAGRERLRRCLDGLSDLQREAIMLAFYSGHIYAEVAAILGIPAGPAKARIRDALIKLRDSMAAGEAAARRARRSPRRACCPEPGPGMRRPDACS
jgi:RNA polymerase sigma-70 factor (ECF subfamily)